MMNLMVRSATGRYRRAGKAEVLEVAAQYLAASLQRRVSRPLTSPAEVRHQHTCNSTTAQLSHEFPRLGDHPGHGYGLTWPGSPAERGAFLAGDFLDRPLRKSAEASFSTRADVVPLRAPRAPERRARTSAAPARPPAQ